MRLSVSHWTSPSNPSLYQCIFFCLVPNEHNPGVECQQTSPIVIEGVKDLIQSMRSLNQADRFTFFVVYKLHLIYCMMLKTFGWNKTLWPTPDFSFFTEQLREFFVFKFFLITIFFNQFGLLNMSVWDCTICNSKCFLLYSKDLGTF
jgi:hypothetical protein